MAYPPSTAAAATPSAGVAVADSYVRSDNPSTNFGKANVLNARSTAPVTRSYLRFDIPGVTGRVTKATLKLFTKGPTSYGLEVRPVLASWEEGTLTYANASAVGDVGAKTPGYQSGVWITIDVTPMVTSGLVNLALTTASPGFLPVSSREVSGQEPQLSIETASPGAAVADSYVRSDNPSTNFGKANVLNARSTAPVTRSYLRFDIPGVTGRVTKATLKLFTKGPTSYGLEVRPVLASWEEGTLTYANASAVGDVGAKTPGYQSGVWITIDVTPMVTSGLVNLALTTASPGFLPVSSREVSGQEPQLSIETAPITTYYVDAVAGNDANLGTSPDKAWQSLQKVSDAAIAPGDKVLFNRGNSWTGTLTLKQSGTRSYRIVVGSYGSGALPVIRGGQSCIYLKGSYTTLTEIQLQDCVWGGADFYGSNNRLEKMLITNNAAGIVINTGSNANVIINNEIKDNNRMSTLTEVPDNDDSGAFGIVIAGDNNEVAYNAISGSYATSFDYGQDGAAVEIYGGRGNFVHHNNTYQNDTFAELGDARAADNTFAYNSVFSTLDSSFFLVTRGPNDVFGPVARTNLYNNSVNLTGPSSQGIVCYAGCSNDILTVKNNVVRAVGKVGYADGPFIQEANLYSGGPIQFETNIPNVLDPGFVNGIGGDLRLTAPSAAIDKGVELGYKKDLDKLGVPFDGNSDGVAVPDIGAFEFRP